MISLSIRNMINAGSALDTQLTRFGGLSSWRGRFCWANLNVCMYRIRHFFRLLSDLHSIDNRIIRINSLFYQYYLYIINDHRIISLITIDFILILPANDHKSYIGRH